MREAFGVEEIIRGGNAEKVPFCIFGAKKETRKKREKYQAVISAFLKVETPWSFCQEVS